MTTDTLQKSYRPPTDADRRQIRADFVAGKGSSTVLAKQYNLCVYTIRNWIRDGNWQALKDRRELAELARVEQGLAPEEPDPVPVRDEVAVLQRHLDATDKLLDGCDRAQDRAALSKARAELAEQLFIARYGSKPGSQRPSRAKPRPFPVQLNPEPVPDPVPVQSNPGPPNPGTGSGSAS